MKKVLFISQKISDGGAERVLSIICNEVSVNNIETVLLVFFPTNNEYCIQPRVKKIYLCKSEAEYRQLSFLEKNKRIRKYFKSENPDFYVPFLFFVGIHTQIAAIGLKGKVVQTVRNDPRSVPENRFERIVRNFIYCFMWRGFVQNDRQLKYFPRFIQKKLVILPNPVSNDFLMHSHISSGGTTIVSMGRLHPQKNFELLIQAGTVLRKKRVNFNIRIYGSGEEVKHLNLLIKNEHLEDYIQLCGRTDNVIEKLEEAEIFVLTSNYEGMPNALMEAMAIGMPCISTNCPTGPSELINDGENGFLIDCNDVDALASKIQFILENKDKGLLLGLNAKNTIKENYSPEKITRRFINEVLLINENI